MMGNHQRIQFTILIMLLIFSLFSNPMIYAVNEYQQASDKNLLAHYPFLEDIKDLKGILSKAKSKLEIPNKDNVRGNITLPNEMKVDGKKLILHGIHLMIKL